MNVALVYGRNVFATGVDRYARELSSGLKSHGVSAHDVPLTRREWRVGRARVGGFASLWLQRLTTRLGSEWDLVHALDPAVATREADVVTLHDLVVETYPEWYQRTIGDRLDWAFTRALARRVPHIVSVSETTRQEAIRRWNVAPERITTVHSGIDHERFRPTLDREAPHLAPDKPNLVYLGDDNPRKNIGLIVEALALLKRERGLDVRFVRMGPTRFPHVHGPYRELARREGVDLVEPGFVPDEDVPAIFSRASAFVWPSVAEGFGFPPLEAMACGASVVALETGINREVCGEQARYHTNDARAAADAIAEVLSKPPSREANRAQALKFTWARCAAETARVYEEVARR